jgi:tetratricopeptide (TPR) repeat protein
MPRVVQALKLWGNGVRTPEVIKQAFGLTDKEYDAKFRSWALARLDRYKGQYAFTFRAKPVDQAKDAVQKAPNDPKAHVGLAFALLREGNRDEAMKEIGRALELDPNQMDAHYLHAQISLRDKDRASAEKHLEAIRKAGGDGFEIEMMLARLADMRKDVLAMKTALERAWQYDPTQPEALEGLLKLARDEKRTADELEILRKLAPISQHNREVWQSLLAGLVQAKQWAEAVKVGESAIFVDVGTAQTHVDYARALFEQNDLERAMYEAESALVCTGIQRKQAAQAHALMARIFAGQKKLPEARQHRDEALKLDPDSDAKQIPIP